MPGTRTRAPKKVVDFLESIARMETETEIGDRTDGDDCMSGDDAVETVSNLIENARALLKLNGVKR